MPRMILTLLVLLTALSPASGVSSDTPTPFWQRPEVQEWIAEIASEHSLSEGYMREVIKTTRYRDDVIGYVKRPAESMPWHRYRKIFLTDKRTADGRAYLKEHAELFAAVERDYGVDAEIIAAIVGVESSYGKNTGKHRVLDALMTLGFDYPPRAKFFRTQIMHLFLLEREAGLSAPELYGSWAGAMGLGQFIPSSYRHFAVDGDGDGKRDLWGSSADVIASIANYFREHNWRSGEPVAQRLEVANPEALPLSEALLPDIETSQLEAAGVKLDHPEHSPVAVHDFEMTDGMEYWAGYHNFYVITRYNHSALYALAVYLLSESLRDVPQ